MQTRKDALIAEYRERLNALRRELACSQSGSEDAMRLRAEIARCEKQLEELDDRADAQRRDSIGAGPTLGGDGKPNLDS